MGLLKDSNKSAEKAQQELIIANAKLQKTRLENNLAEEEERSEKIKQKKQNADLARLTA